MSADEIHLPDVSEDEDRTLNLLLNKLDEKHPRNFLRASYYDGKRAIRQITQVVPPQYYRLGIVLGWTAKAVDDLARICNLDGFDWADGDLDSLGVDEVWEDNFLGAEINSAIISSLIHGVSFLVNTEGDEDDLPSSLIHVKDAMNATGEWNVRARRLDNLLSITGRGERGEPTALSLYLNNETIVAEKSDGKWVVDRNEHTWGVPAEPLIYKYRVGREFGMSRISRPLMSLQDLATRSVVRLEGHADVYSFPEMWMLGADESIFVNADGSQRPQWQVMLGRIKGIPDDEDAANPRAQVQQFAAQSPAPGIDMLKQWANLFAGEAHLPVTALGVQAETNTTTADGSDNAKDRLVAEAEGATDDWAPAIRRTMNRALAIANDLDEVPAEWRTVKARWRDPRYMSRAAQADAGSKQIATAPWLAETEVGLELLGLSRQQVDRAMAEKRRVGALSAVMQRIQQQATQPQEPAPEAAVEEPQPTPQGGEVTSGDAS